MFVCQTKFVWGAAVFCYETVLFIGAHLSCYDMQLVYFEVIRERIHNGI